jgi:hypothetical protein
VRESEQETRRLTDSGQTSPCGPGGSIGPEWISDYWESDDPEDPGYEVVAPLCVEIYEDRIPAGSGEEGERQVVEYSMVQELLRCSKEYSYEVAGTADGAEPLGGADNGKSPFRVETGTSLGDDDFQLRAVVFGELPSSRPEGVMRIAAFGRCDGESSPCNSPALSVASQIGRISVAQAEYFYDGSEERDEWLWNYRWRARLRRFHFDSQEEADKRNRRNPAPRRPEAEYAPGPAPTSALDACQLNAGSTETCSSILANVDRLGPVLLH